MTQNEKSGILNGNNLRHSYIQSNISELAQAVISQSWHGNKHKVDDEPKHLDFSLANFLTSHHLTGWEDSFKLVSASGRRVTVEWN